MAGSLRSRNRRNISADKVSKSAGVEGDDVVTSDIEVYSKEVLNALIDDNLPPTPNNFSLYFDRLLEDKSENLRKQILSMLEYGYSCFEQIYRIYQYSFFWLRTIDKKSQATIF